VIIDRDIKFILLNFMRFLSKKYDVPNDYIQVINEFEKEMKGKDVYGE